MMEQLTKLFGNEYSYLVGLDIGIWLAFLCSKDATVGAAAIGIASVTAGLKGVQCWHELRQTRK
ncbi:hypothetical protein C5B42_03350 [Candidatus Cerribacteria bacterium 'Amazon FNV 2010 28 9']|uniref:Uncharacterized protein n=1 Tax=Candidatus Cerribacteria bacterium 'Amazon FNV 2010 28 9' TaxID=2081795 RepID=A0A317JPV5_9BACT|nr:MAG: hypothetical protein C5B42_03350 [Candidatus Cerribacteria bacterium 'Amazon FNV 2010 28 9']